MWFMVKSLQRLIFRNGGSSYYLHFLYTRPVYQNYNLQRATNTNRGKIDGVCLVLATKDINIPCMHAEVRRLVCMALH